MGGFVRDVSKIVILKLIKMIHVYLVLHLALPNGTTGVDLGFHNNKGTCFYILGDLFFNFPINLKL